MSTGGSSTAARSRYPVSGAGRLWLPAMLAVVACTGQAQNDRVPLDSTATLGASLPATLPALDSGATTLVPIDQADSTFRAFRQQLLGALARRDSSFLFSILSPDIRNSFGPDDGIAGFRDKWQPADPDSPLWDALSRVLMLGGGLVDSTFVAPYVAAFWPDSLDGFEHVAVTAERVPVRTAPQPDGPVIGTVSYAVLPADEWIGMGESWVATDSSWVRVRLAGIDAAWLRATDVHSPTGWRAFFERRDGRWLLTTFLAGD